MDKQHVSDNTEYSKKRESDSDSSKKQQGTPDSDSSKKQESDSDSKKQEEPVSDSDSSKKQEEPVSDSEYSSKNHVPLELTTERYKTQAAGWPLGSHIVAQFTSHAVLVYQAYNSSIGTYAVENKKFLGCDAFSMERMTWIKTSFLWMMFRSDWGRKSNQCCVLGIWLKRSAFDRYLEQCSLRSCGTVTIRLQWDPDHDPHGQPIKKRRAIQLGLKGVHSFASGDDILHIVNLTPFVRSCDRTHDFDNLVTPKETVYPLSDELKKHLGSE